MMEPARITATRLHIVLASLMGFTGVLLLALAAHGGGNDTLRTAAEFCLFHAPVILGATALRDRGLIARRVGALAIACLILGVALFSGDLAMRGFQARSLFPYAAPIGGSLTMLGWLLLAWR